MIKKLILEHQTIASVLTIILSVAAINAWWTSDLRQDTKDLNKRIDALFHYVLTKEDMKK
jgi:hypothetical protein